MHTAKAIKISKIKNPKKFLLDLYKINFLLLIFPPPQTIFGAENGSLRFINVNTSFAVQGIKQNADAAKQAKHRSTTVADKWKRHTDNRQ